MRGCSEPLLQKPDNLGRNETRRAAGVIHRRAYAEMRRPGYRGSPDEELGLLQGEKEVFRLRSGYHVVARSPVKKKRYLIVGAGCIVDRRRLEVNRTVVHRSCTQELLEGLIARSRYQLMIPMLDQIVDNICSNDSLHFCTYRCIGIARVRSGKRSDIARQRSQGDQVRSSRIAHERHSLRIGLQIIRLVSDELYRRPDTLNGLGITWLTRL